MFNSLTHFTHSFLMGKWGLLSLFPHNAVREHEHEFENEKERDPWGLEG